MNKNYNSGRSFEYRVKKHMEKKGWTVFRTAGSHSPVDLICFCSDDNPKYGVVFIQCKHKCGGGKMMNKKEIKELEELINDLEVCGYVAFNDEHGHIFLQFVGKHSLLESRRDIDEV